jgi:hypothetical protein
VAVESIVISLATVFMENDAPARSWTAGSKSTRKRKKPGLRRRSRLQGNASAKREGRKSGSGGARQRRGGRKRPGSWRGKPGKSWRTRSLRPMSSRTVIAISI